MTAIPDVLYAVSARVMRHESVIGSSLHWAVNLPTFYLDSRVQGITDEAHAERIVRSMLRNLGYKNDDVTVQVSATLAPCVGRAWLAMQEKGKRY